MTDTWSDIQATRRRQESLRERLQRRKKEKQPETLTGTEPSIIPSGGQISGNSSNTSASAAAIAIQKFNPKLERKLLECLSDPDVNFPVDSSAIQSRLKKTNEDDVLSLTEIESLLQKFSAQKLIVIEVNKEEEQRKLIVISAEHSKLTAVCNELNEMGEKVSKPLKRKRESDNASPKAGEKTVTRLVSKSEKIDTDAQSVESLLSMPSTKESRNKKFGDEIYGLLSQPTAKEQSVIEKFRSQEKQVQEFCPHGTRDECRKNRTPDDDKPCKKLHFRRIIKDHTDESLGDCSFLNTCFHMDTCKYVHYEIDYPDKKQEQSSPLGINIQSSRKLERKDSSVALYPPQWIQCDLRNFDMTVLGKFAVIMADPPWDIHMELPYGTMSDDEMRKLNIPSLQDEGFIFLWVTGRAMELGRECLKLWGYRQCDEIIWVKTNQLQRLIRTGRTGHWLNHGKEHCLVGVKGNPAAYNTGLDTDVMIAEVRETSHKPDEIYGVIERLSPGTRKVELFGRPHNVQPNWVTLGNQLDGVNLLDSGVVERFTEEYDDGNCMNSQNKKTNKT